MRSQLLKRLRSWLRLPSMSAGCGAKKRSAVRALIVAHLLILLGTGPGLAGVQRLSPAQRAAQAAIARWPTSTVGVSPASQPTYGLGFLLDGMDALWYNTADPRYYKYTKQSIDRALTTDGQIGAYEPSASSDAALLGRQLLLLYGVTQDKKYYDAATLLQKQLSSGRELETGYLDAAFLAEYASAFRESEDFAEITPRFAVAGKSILNMRATSLYMVALVDTLPYYPKEDPGRAKLLTILNRSAATVAHDQNPNTGLWDRRWEKSGKEGAHLEISTPCLFTYALAKGVRLGYLPEQYEANARRAWASIEKKFAQMAASDAPAATGAFVLAGSEMDLEDMARTGTRQKVLLDAWYNSQKRTNAAGQSVYFHYKWDDYSNPGFSLFGHIFRSYGLATDTLYSEPTFTKLRNAQYYIIVSPDNSAKNPDPHYMTETDSSEIARWVKSGGVLLVMENDPANADIPHMNLLADKFGLHFNNVLAHHVVGDQHEMGRMDVTADGTLFHQPHVLFMKDTCSLTLGKGAVSLLRDKGDVLMAYAKYGKGTVYAVTDPWLYNEYTDGRNLPPDYDNFRGGMELVRWLLQQRGLTTH